MRRIPPPCEPASNSREVPPGTSNVTRRGGPPPRGPAYTSSQAEPATSPASSASISRQAKAPRAAGGFPKRSGPELDARGRRQIPPAGPAGHPRGVPSPVGPLDNRSGTDDAVDGIEGVRVEVDHRPAEQVLELFVGPRTEDRGGDG